MQWKSDVVDAIQYLFKLGSGLVLNATDVLHCEAVPLVNGAKHLPVEVKEQTVVRVHNEVLHFALKTPPLELARHKLVRRHHRLLFL